MKKIASVLAIFLALLLPAQFALAQSADTQTALSAEEFQKDARTKLNNLDKQIELLRAMLEERKSKRMKAKDQEHFDQHFQTIDQEMSKAKMYIQTMEDF